MASKKQVLQDIAEMTDLEELTRVYGEIASIRMKNTRDSVLSSRGFLGSVNSVFQDVLASYRREVLKLVQEKGASGKGGLTLLAHNGKVVSVLLSANTGLYGSVVRETFNLFLNDVRKSDTEVSIVGKLGKALILNEEPNRPYTYFDIPDKGSDFAKLSELIRHLVQYEEIIVYYGQFQNVLNQSPTKFTISAQTLLTDVETSGRKQEKNFVFEPSLERILQFFETEIFASLFEQTVRESQLAKFASRILAMDTAQGNIEENLAKLKLAALRSEHRIINRKQLNQLAGIAQR